MKSCYRLFQRKTGVWFWENRQTGQQGSLRTSNKTEAGRLLNAKNEAQGSPALAIHIAKAYLAAADPTLNKRTWRYTVGELIKTKHGENARRWETAIKDSALKRIMDVPLIETRADHFLAALNDGTVSTNVFLRRLHNFAVGMGWLLLASFSTISRPGSSKSSSDLERGRQFCLPASVMSATRKLWRFPGGPFDFRLQPNSAGGAVRCGCPGCLAVE